MEQKLRIEYVALSKLEKWPRNPKSHALDEIGGSMDRFGYTSPILIDETSHRMVAGHGRVDVLVLKKDSGAPPPERILVKDGEWFIPVVRGLTFKDEKEAEAYLLADNQTVILGGYDQDLLDAMLKDHTVDLLGTGFHPEDLIPTDPPLPEVPEQKLGFIVSVEVKTERERDKLVKLLHERHYETQVSAARL